MCSSEIPEGINDLCEAIFYSLCVQESGEGNLVNAYVVRKGVIERKALGHLLGIVSNSGICARPIAQGPQMFESGTG